MSETKTTIAVPKPVEKTEPDMEYVEIPEKDFTGVPYPTIRLNHLKFEAGKPHHVTSEIAKELKSIMKRHDFQVRRLLLPDQDPLVIQRLGGGAIVYKYGNR